LYGLVLLGACVLSVVQYLHAFCRSCYSLHIVIFTPSLPFPGWLALVSLVYGLVLLGACVLSVGAPPQMERRADRKMY